MVIEAQARLPMAVFRGPGTTASSDGQFFPTTRQGEAMNLVNARYGNEPGLRAYTHVSDRFGPFATQIITATAGEAPYILDGLLMNETGRHVRERYADTGSFTPETRAAAGLKGCATDPRDQHGASAPPTGCLRGIRAETVGGYRPLRPRTLSVGGFSGPAYGSGSGLVAKRQAAYAARAALRIQAPAPAARWADAHLADLQPNDARGFFLAGHAAPTPSTAQTCNYPRLPGTPAGPGPCSSAASGEAMVDRLPSPVSASLR